MYAVRSAGPGPLRIAWPEPSVALDFAACPSPAGCAVCVQQLEAGWRDCARGCHPLPVKWGTSSVSWTCGGEPAERLYRQCSLHTIVTVEHNHNTVYCKHACRLYISLQPECDRPCQQPRRYRGIGSAFKVDLLALPPPQRISGEWAVRCSQPYDCQMHRRSPYLARPAIAFSVIWLHRFRL